MKTITVAYLEPESLDECLEICCANCAFIRRFAEPFALRCLNKIKLEKTINKVRRVKNGL